MCVLTVPGFRQYVPVNLVGVVQLFRDMEERGAAVASINSSARNTTCLELMYALRKRSAPSQFKSHFDTPNLQRKVITTRKSLR